MICVSWPSRGCSEEHLHIHTLNQEENSVTNLIYAGVGSRQTPSTIQESMTLMGFQMSQSGWHLRSGYAEGADKAFGLGAAQQSELSDQDRWVMYLPWRGFNGAPKDGDPRFQVCFPTQDLTRVAKECHPAWDRLNRPAQLLMIRNVAIVAGIGLGEPANLLIGWTPNARRGGGTGHAMRVAEMIGVPVFDLASAYERKACVEYINACEETHRNVQF
jgi:hypothetical protein